MSQEKWVSGVTCAPSFHGNADKSTWRYCNRPILNKYGHHNLFKVQVHTADTEHVYVDAEFYGKSTEIDSDIYDGVDDGNDETD